MYTLMESLWKRAMQKILNTTDNTINNNNSVSVNKTVDVGATKKMLDDNMKIETLQKTFKLFNEQLIQGCCTCNRFLMISRLFMFVVVEWVIHSGAVVHMP